MLHHTICGKCKRCGLLGLLGLLLFLLCSCTAKPSIIGIWRLESGRFSYMSNSYDKCAIEFTDMGEYILYEGDNYENDYYHGSYTFSDKQISMVIDNMFRSSANCTIDGDRMVLVTSRGSATFVRIDTTAPAGRFDDSAIGISYQNEGYQIADVNLTESSEYTRVYQTKITQSYQYMDEEILRQDCYAYSKIGQHWYLESSKEISANENWHINGLWTYNDSWGTNRSLYIYSFTSTDAVVDYRVDSDYEYSGNVSVDTHSAGIIYDNRELSRLWFPDWGGVSIDRDAGVLYHYGISYSPYTYHGE